MDDEKSYIDVAKCRNCFNCYEDNGVYRCKARHIGKTNSYQVVTLESRCSLFEESSTPIAEPQKKLSVAKPEILLPQEGKILNSEFILEVAKLLSATDTFYRVADDSIVEIVNGQIKIVKPTRMITLIEEVCIPCMERWDDNKKQYFFNKKSTGEQVAKILLESPQLRNNLRKIKRVIDVPMPILQDGKLTFPKEGYNDDLELFLVVGHPEIPLFMDLEEAKSILFGILKEFCFKSEKDCLRALMALLTPFCRGLYSQWTTRTPMFIYFANRERAGKDYLAGIRGIVYEGYSTEEPPIATGDKKSNSNDELRKKILSALSSGRMLLHFANNKGYIDNSCLEQIITAQVFSDRVLGTNKIAKFENCLEISISGNIGTSLTPDLSNRSIIITLFLDIENANEREFDNPYLHDYIRKNRGIILGALYSLIRNWYSKGMPKSEVLFASFPEWIAICGGIMETAGFINPCAVRDDVNITLDSELEEMRKLYELIYEKHADQAIKKADIKYVIEEYNQQEVNGIFPFFDFNERSSQSKFGRLLDKFIGRTISGITMITDLTEPRAARRAMIFTKTKQERNLDLNSIFSTGNKGGIKSG